MHLPAWLKAIIDFLPPRTTPRTAAEEPAMSEPLVPATTPAQPTIGTTTTTTTSIDATTGQTIFHTIVADAEAVVAKIEDEFKVVEADLGIGAQASSTTPSTAPANIVQKVGELLALAGRTPVAYAEIADLAIAAVGTDTDVVLAKIKDLLAYSGSKIDVWDQVVAVAKAV